MGTSTFAEATVMPEIALAKVGPDVPPEGASIFACGLSTGLGAAIYTAQVEPGSTCAVFGCGLVGLGAIAGCRLRGAERIFAIDLSEERLAMARHHGATDTMLAGEDVVDALKEADRRLRLRLHLRGHRASSRSCARPSSRRARPGASPR